MLIGINVFIKVVLIKTNYICIRVCYLGVQKKKLRGKLKMAAEAAKDLLKECKSIIEKYQAKSK